MAWTNLFKQQLNAYGAEPESYQLATSAPDYQLPSYTPESPNLGNYGSQLSMGSPTTSSASGLGGTAINAGAQAAATTAALVSQAVAANAQREAMAEQSGLDRETREKLAKMQLAESSRAFNETSKQSAYRTLMSALSAQMSNEDASFAGKQHATRGVDEALASAMLSRRK